MMHGKVVTTAVLLGLAAPAIAQMGQGGGQMGPGPMGMSGNFEQNKTEMIQRLDKRIQNLTEAKSCFSAAQNAGDAQKCHQVLRAENMEMRGDRMSKRKARMEKRMEQMNEKDGKTQ